MLIFAAVVAGAANAQGSRHGRFEQLPSPRNPPHSRLHTSGRGEAPSAQAKAQPVFSMHGNIAPLPTPPQKAPFTVSTPENPVLRTDRSVAPNRGSSASAEAGQGISPVFPRTTLAQGNTSDATSISSKPGRSSSSQQHLSEWMNAHRHLPLGEQQNALEKEPGFRQLQPQEQQRMHDRLSQLSRMDPQQQQRVLSRTEAMERLAPAQRQQIRGAMQQLGSLPEERRRAVARTFRSLRELPPQQREAYMNSPQLKSEFSEAERGALNGLLNVAPLLPPPPPR